MEYLNDCRSAAVSINPDDIAALRPAGKGGTGSKFIFQVLEQVACDYGGLEHIGLKIPQANASVRNRMVNEIALIDFYSNHSPAVAVRAPGFMFGVKVEGTDIEGIIMEDVSQGGELRVRPRPASETVRQQLYEPFRDLGAPDQVLHADALDRTLACDAAGSERLIDFTPRPVNRNRVVHERLAGYVIAVEQNLDDLTIQIPRTSPLGLSLRDQYES